ncbi:protein lethal(2)essential for life-like [Uranotaenia lowii]|uniref:protein lethal(2)essential for life-like n=1 Tax=Uranotaenia lowii TaxID=190385 RepID=UPI00247A3872|nr:protein lethal(2)essential for life-like [Uranotaenia lowii]
MSQIPISFRNWWDDPWFDRPFRSHSLLDQHFGTGLFDDDLFQSMATCHPMDLRRMGFQRSCSWFGDDMRQLNQRISSGLNLLDSKDKWLINLDVQQFSPEELTVKTVDNAIIVEGKHEEKQDEHGYISRHFVRRYVLPKDLDPKAVVSSLSSDGVLTVTAPKKPQLQDSAAQQQREVPIVAPQVNIQQQQTAERTIPITQTNENSQ